MSPPPQLVVGLGNPGPTYRDTRHNTGHMVVDRVAARLGCPFRLRGQAVVGEATWAGGRLHLAKPVAFMNVSGPPVARLLRDLGLDPAHLILVHDDLDLPFGRVRVRQKGGHGGHNGVRSLVETLGTEAFRRVKVGVGRPATKAEVADWLLTEFDAEARAALPEILARAADAALELAAAGPVE